MVPPSFPAQPQQRVRARAAWYAVDRAGWAALTTGFDTATTPLVIEVWSTVLALALLLFGAFVIPTPIPGHSLSPDHHALSSALHTLLPLTLLPWLPPVVQWCAVRWQLRWGHGSAACRRATGVLPSIVVVPPPPCDIGDDDATLHPVAISERDAGPSSWDTQFQQRACPAASSRTWRLAVWGASSTVVTVARMGLLPRAFALAPAWGDHPLLCLLWVAGCGGATLAAWWTFFFTVASVSAVMRARKAHLLLRDYVSNESPPSLHPVPAGVLPPLELLLLRIVPWACPLLLLDVAPPASHRAADLVRAFATLTDGSARLTLATWLTLCDSCLLPTASEPGETGATTGDGAAAGAGGVDARGSVHPGLPLSLFLEVAEAPGAHRGMPWSASSFSRATRSAASTTATFDDFRYWLLPRLAAAVGAALDAPSAAPGSERQGDAIRRRHAAVVDAVIAAAARAPMHPVSVPASTIV